MTDARWQRTQELFHAALALHPGRREAFLTQACASDADLLAEVTALLAAHEEDDGALEGPLRLDAPRIADFEILEEIGAGSMGVVYRAWHYPTERVVAIKAMIRHKGTDPTLLERFRREAHSMAKLDHPAIVRVHEVGEVDELPYFVMEFVAGRDLAQELALHGTPEAERGEDVPLYRRMEPTPGSRRVCGCASRSPTRSSTRTAPASCTATSSRTTSCSTRTGRHT